MRTAFLFSILAIVLAAEPLCAHYKHWRLGASYVRMVDDSSRGLFGDAWAVSGEYSFTDALSEEEVIRDDIAFAFQFRRFDTEASGVVRTMDYVTYGFKWRKGPGAATERDGFYGGIGLAAAMVRIVPAFDGAAAQGTTKFEWSVFGGASFARSLYAEVGYSRIPNTYDVGFGQVLFTIGGRF